MKRLLVLAAALVAIAVLPPPAAHSATASTGTATWTWQAPTQYTDGTSIPSGTAITYNVYLGVGGPGSEAATPAQTGVTALTATSTGYAAGVTVCGEITAVTAGLESAKSNEACKTFPETPNAPAALTVK